MEQIEAHELSDDRWRHLVGASFARLVDTGDGTLVLYCAPTFVKVRVRDGVPLDAKAYLQAGARVM